MNLQEKCKQLAILKELKERHESLAELASKRYAVLSAEIYKDMVDSDTDNMKISGDVFADKKSRSISPAIKLAPRVVDDLQFHFWLKENNEGALIKQYVHPASIQSLCKRYIEANLTLPSKEILDVFKVETANVRRV